MTETCSMELARFAAELAYAKLPSEVVENVRLRVLDTVGVCLASVGMEYASAIADVVRSQGGRPEATLFGQPDRLPATWAALYNGALAHGNDFDDTHSVALVHPSGVIIPTMLAVAERIGATGREAMTAAVAGYEVGLRIGMAVPGGFHARGFHATGVCGTFAAAVTAGRLGRLDAHVDGLLLRDRPDPVVEFVDLPKTLVTLANYDLHSSLFDLLGREWTDDRLCGEMATRIAGVGWVSRVNFVRRTGGGRSPRRFGPGLTAS